MAFKSDEYGRRTLDFVQRLQQLSEYKDICRHIVKEMEWFGFTCVSSFSIPRPGTTLKDSIWFNNRPKDWSDRYVEKNQVNVDPIVKELRRNLNPYSWSDIEANRGYNKSEKRIMEEAHDFGAADGLVIPIVTLSGSTSLFSPCGPKPDLTQRARAALEIIGIYSHHALQRAMVKQQREGIAHTPLTAREREILQWVAAGKSDDEIGDILSIGTATVTSHVENAKRKLDAFRRTYAVVQAIRLGEISL